MLRTNEREKVEDIARVMSLGYPEADARTTNSMVKHRCIPEMIWASELDNHGIAQHVKLLPQVWKQKHTSPLTGEGEIN